MNFSQRLKSERLRLGLTQEEMAKAGGVSRRAQVGYEAGSSAPDARYLEAVSAVGIDGYYLASGKRLGDERNQVAAAEILLSEVAKAHGLRGDSFTAAWEEVIAVIPETVITEGTHTTVAMEALDSIAERGVAAILSLSPRFLDEATMEAVLVGLDQALADQGLTATPTRKAKMSMLIYRQARLVGALDSKMISDVVALAGTGS